MSEVIYVSKVRIERFGGGHRRAHLPVGEPADFGVHDEIAEHYGMTPASSSPTRPPWTTWWRRPAAD